MSTQLGKKQDYCRVCRYVAKPTTGRVYDSTYPKEQTVHCSDNSTTMKTLHTRPRENFSKIFFNSKKETRNKHTANLALRYTSYYFSSSQKKNYSRTYRHPGRRTELHNVVRQYDSCKHLRGNPVDYFCVSHRETA